MKKISQILDAEAELMGCNTIASILKELIASQNELIQEIVEMEENLRRLMDDIYNLQNPND